MRIDGRHAFAQAYVQRVGSTRRPNSAPANSSVGKDDVSLSRFSQGLKIAEEQEASLAAPARERLAALRARIERGDYHVSAEALADRILQSCDLDAPAGLRLM